jgi:hypothetical protein
MRPAPSEPESREKDSLSEELGIDSVMTMTSAEDQSSRRHLCEERAPRNR